MKRRWVALVGGLGLAIGVVAGPTLFADEATDKQQLVQHREVVAAAQTGTATTDTKFVEIEPARAFDSRIPAYIASGAFPPNTSRVVAIRDGHSAAGAVIAHDIVPVGATAVAYNVTITGPTGPNFVAVTAGDATGFTTSAINFNGTSDVANAGIVSIDMNRTVRIWNGDQSGTTHVIIDITGYFVKPLFAEVARNGMLLNGSRVISVTTPSGIGTYNVRFDRDVTGCAFTATIGRDGGLGEPAGLIDFTTVGNDTVLVYTADNDGSPPPPANRAFHLVVTC